MTRIEMSKPTPDEMAKLALLTAQVCDMLQPLDDGAQRRVLGWVCDYFGYELRDVLQHRPRR